ncbi:transcription factor HBP-1b(c38) isoform X2 [Triticum dicoccoides]|uniref:transcription factor HBP-1b(c38) isoform X2 n=1 Tax=Triticum dicoccoides TaxID=85692 RepID=UPI00188E6071|nr:transcription factor HBP-1b(c38) isoform X2 [Triticum dicoccoides]
MAEASPRTETSTDDTDENLMLEPGNAALAVVSDSSDRSRDKNGDQKTMRRLAQNREAARKSRLRKKAYVQQLENSRLKLTQLEQELQRARQQGIFISSSADQSHSMSGNGALAFDTEYARWLEEHNRQVNELRAAVNAHAGDTELRSVVEKIMSHYDEIFKQKGNAAKADVFHVLSGMWKTPAERCFLWLGGFRPSELLKGYATFSNHHNKLRMLFHKEWRLFSSLWQKRWLGLSALLDLDQQEMWQTTWGKWPWPWESLEPLKISFVRLTTCGSRLFSRCKGS